MQHPAAKAPLTILHTNDFHNRLTDAMKSLLRRLVADAPGQTLLIDAGDAGGSTNITFRPAGEPILDEMSHLGYAAMTVGNRDFHVSRPGFAAKLSRARFPVLCANIRPSGTPDAGAQSVDELPLAASRGREPHIRRYIVRDAGGWRVLVFGLTVPMVTPRMWERKLSAYVFDPPLSTAARLVPELHRRFDPDITIALTHIGLRLDRELAGQGLGIDLIAGGHSHELLPQGETIGGTLVVQAGSHGHYAGVVTVAPAGAAGARPLLTARVEAA
ncbi:MAG TPA: metallophosphoesterase [Chthonomonadaceae bacterium]|nr:metallophosphoesterase [Chthonomonadaceae bacterium]